MYKKHTTRKSESTKVLNPWLNVPKTTHVHSEYIIIKTKHDHAA